MITQLLPGSLQVRLSDDADRPDGVEEARDKSHVSVKIINETAGEEKYVPVEYEKVRSFVSETYARHTATAAKIDFYLHIGMADGWDAVAVERLAFKQGMSSTWWNPREELLGYYMIPDVSQQYFLRASLLMFNKNAGKTIADSGPSPWARLPMSLDTAFDVDGLVEAANGNLVQAKTDASASTTETPLKVKSHLEPGSYCCGFIFYESLAQCFVRGKERNVLFCHVPGETDRASIEKGRDAIVAVIEAAVLQLLARRGAESEERLGNFAKLTI